jgi:hypothetical protein
MVPDFERSFEIQAWRAAAATGGILAGGARHVGEVPRGGEDPRGLDLAGVDAESGLLG